MPELSTRACSKYQDFIERGNLFNTRLLTQGYQRTKLVSTLKIFYGRHHDIVYPYNVAVSRIVLMFLPLTSPKQTFKIPDLHFSRPLLLISVQTDRHGGRSMLTKYLITPFVCWSFVYRFMSLIYGLGTLTTDFFFAELVDLHLTE